MSATRIRSTRGPIRILRRKPRALARSLVLKVFRLSHLTRRLSFSLTCPVWWRRLVTLLLVIRRVPRTRLRMFPSRWSLILRARIRVSLSMIARNGRRGRTRCVLLRRAARRVDRRTRLVVCRRVRILCFCCWSPRSVRRVHRTRGRFTFRVVRKRPLLVLLVVRVTLLVCRQCWRRVRAFLVPRGRWWHPCKLLICRVRLPSRIPFILPYGRRFRWWYRLRLTLILTVVRVVLSSGKRCKSR